jgi:hypothetical protein
LISEVQSRGANGGSDEFVEIYNPTGAPVLFDGSWAVWARGSNCATAAVQRFTGLGQTIPAHGHILYAGSMYNGAVVADAVFATGITDASSVVLIHNSVAVDALCFGFDDATLAVFTTCTAPSYTCEGTAMNNQPHDNTSGVTSNVNASLERKPGGSSGNAQDTNNNAADFAKVSAPTPQNLFSLPTP